MSRNLFAVPAFAIASFFALAAIAQDSVSREESEEIRVEADVLTLLPDRDWIEATGRVRLEVGDLRIDADKLRLDTKKARMELDAPKTAPFPDRTTTLEGRRALCENGVCRLDDIRGSACPHKPSGYEIRAESATVYRSGDIDLRHPALVIDDRAVAKLPWIRLRPPGSSGFLAPRLGFSREGGLVIGPAGYIPLGQNASAEGYLAARTSEGFETGSRIVSRDWELALDHIADIPDKEGDARLRTRGASSLKGLSVAIESDISTNRKLIDDMASDPLDRAITHTASRGLLSAEFKGVIVETYVELLQTFDDKGRFSIDAPTPGITLALSVPSAPVADLFWPAIDVKFSRWGLAKGDPVPGSDLAPVLGHTRLELSPRLDLPIRLGPFPLTIFAGTRHQLWLPDSPAEATTAVHLAALGVDLRAPIARSFSGFRHVVDPYLRYRITPWLHGNNPSWVVDDFDRLERGHGLEAGILTQFDRMRANPMAQFDVMERIDLRGLGRSFAPAYLYGRGSFGPLWLRLSLDAAWDHKQPGPSLAGISFSSEHKHENRIEFGGRWIGPGRGPHQDRPFGGAVGPWLVSAWPDFPEEQVELFEKLSLSLTRRLGATVGTRLGVWPAPALHALSYGLKFGSFCGCIKMEVIASHRLASPVPDVWVTFNVAGI